MRAVKPAPGEYYHLYNRGMGKRTIFHDDYDRARFLFLILYFQSPKTFINIGRNISYFVKHRVFNISAEHIHEVVNNRFIELVAFCLMPNHFHLAIKNNADDGISFYMQRVLNSYTKYYNQRYKTSGHLFQGPYKLVHIVDDRQFLHLSAYIHKNPTELMEWKGKLGEYEWSSYRDFVSTNRWPLLKPEIILEQFNTVASYDHFVTTSPAKKLHTMFMVE